MSGARLRSCLAQIDEQIISLQSQLARLQTDRKSVIDELAAIVYPVLSLPHDVTAKIFLHYVHEDYDTDVASTRTDRPILLASICASWREVALANPHLWTHLDTTRIPRAWNHKMDLLQTFMSRAGRLPVNFRTAVPSYKAPEHAEILDLIGRHLSQCGSLDLFLLSTTSIPINTTVQLPHLTSLSFSGGYAIAFPPLFNAPRLGELRLQGVSLVDWRTCLPWSQLTTLRLFYPKSMDECCEMVLQTPNLELLELSHFNSRVFWSVSDESAQPQIFPRLHTLHLCGAASYDIIPRLTLPALRDVSVTKPPSDFPSVAKNLIERSECSPATLFISTNVGWDGIHPRCLTDSFKPHIVLWRNEGRVFRGATQTPRLAHLPCAGLSHVARLPVKAPVGAARRDASMSNKQARPAPPLLVQTECYEGLEPGCGMR
ncbi:hypothetical protein FB45DRAFT_243082 [Roridomyces roridus]|uniref:F-box domain-containing protein n=1 Tax=Roridomyces roridus TaxID=1738132 RepID=A0AAD7BB41_9AGAR|nr:hypothetical protein FB45DRAFT_243082 [Roridomyces roridus]